MRADGRMGCNIPKPSRTEPWMKDLIGSLWAAELEDGLAAIGTWGLWPCWTGEVESSSRCNWACSLSDCEAALKALLLHGVKLSGDDIVSILGGRKGTYERGLQLTSTLSHERYTRSTVDYLSMFLFFSASPPESKNKGNSDNNERDNKHSKWSFHDKERWRGFGREWSDECQLQPDATQRSATEWPGRSKPCGSYHDTIKPRLIRPHWVFTTSQFMGYQRATNTWKTRKSSALLSPANKLAA